MNSLESLRDEILDTIEHYYQMRFSSIHAMDTIINAIEKRIDEMIEETHNNARRIHEDQPDYMYFRAKAIGMMQIKELLKQ